jgi:hypothetical protein
MEIIKSWIVNNTFHSEGPTQLVLCQGYFGMNRYFIWTSYNQWLEIPDWQAMAIIQDSTF